MDTTGDERSDVVSKIVSLVQQFAPSSMWQVDTLLTVLRLSGNLVHDEVLSTLAEVVSHESDDLACYTVGDSVVSHADALPSGRIGEASCDGGVHADSHVDDRGVW